MNTPPPSPSNQPEFPGAFHQSFSWLLLEHKHNEREQFYAMTVDGCEGIKTCLDIVHLSNSDRNTDTAPTLDIVATERLLRLALMLSQLLADMAARRIDRLDDRTSR
ncbi:hypothetical protein ACXX82_03825 [Glaciimonas sp. GNP009]